MSDAFLDFIAGAIQPQGGSPASKPEPAGESRTAGGAAAAPAAAGPQEFVRQNLPLAQAVSERTGVAPELLLGQWGLETGWGKSVIPGTNNLGNIKDPSGRGVRATDNMTGSNDAYRAYASPEDFGRDFAGLLSRRYKGALDAGGDAQRYFQALKQGGYAEDPDYIAKGARAASTAAAAMSGASGRQASAPGGGNFYTPQNTQLVGRDREPQKSRSFGEAATDNAIGLGAGLLQGLGMLAGAAGADNPVATTLRGAADDLTAMQSPARQEQREQRAAAIKEAEQFGSTLDEIKAFAGAFADAPVETVLSAIGTSAPTLLTALIPGLNGATAARLIATGAMGATQGAGVVKGEIYEAVERKLIERGVDRDTAAKTAAGAQAYDGPNTDQILLGMGLGAAAASTGFERALGAVVSRKAAADVAQRAAPGVAARIATGVAKETPVEMVQGGQERVASNVALQREGFDVPTFQGAAGQAVLEGLASAPLGAVGGLIDPVTAKAAEPNTPLSKAAVAGGGVAQPPAPLAPPVDPAQRLAELEAKAKGTPEQVLTGLDGQPITIPGQPGAIFTSEEQQEYQQLKAARDATPGAVQDEIAPKAFAIREQLRDNRGMLDALRAEGSPYSAQALLKDLSVAASRSTQPAMREQALNRAEMAMEWAAANPLAPIETNLDELPGVARGDERPAGPRPTVPQLRAGADRDAALLAQRDGSLANPAGNRTRDEADRREQAAIDIESAPNASPETLDRAVALRQQAAPLRRRADELDTRPGAAGTPGTMTARDRAGIDEQRQTNLEQRMRAPEVDRSGAIPAQDRPEPIGATEQARLDASALAGSDRQRRAEDDPRQVVINRALRSVEERGGVASPAEARIFQEAGVGRPYDRIDETLAAQPSVDERLTQATGIALGRRPRESVRLGQQSEADLVAQEQRERSDSRLQAMAAERAAAQAGRPGERPAAAPPAAGDVIGALKTIPALRTADQKSLIDIARRSYSAKQMRIMSDAAVNSANLSATDKLQLQQLRDIRRSEERAAPPLQPGEARVTSRSAVVGPQTDGTPGLQPGETRTLGRAATYDQGPDGTPGLEPGGATRTSGAELAPIKGTAGTPDLAPGEARPVGRSASIASETIDALQSPSFLRKRRAQIEALAARGLETVERRGSAFVMRNAKTGEEVRLQGRADAALARQAVKSLVDQAARTAATSPESSRPDPTDAQIHNKDGRSNYKKGDPITLNGVTVRIENPVGSIRRARPDAPVQWKTTMKHHYGEIAGTKGADGDPVDVFVGPNPASPKIWVIDQVDEKGEFDEHKVMFGFDNEAAARAGYLSNFSSGWKGLGKITEMTQEEFRAWAKDRGATMAPAAEAAPASAPAVDSSPTAVDSRPTTTDSRTTAATPAPAPAASAAPAPAPAPAPAEEAAPAPADPKKGQFTVQVSGKSVILQRTDRADLGDFESPARGGRAMKVSKRSAAIVEAIAQALGKKVVFFSDINNARPGDGFILPNKLNTIYLNEASTINPLSVLGHELLHILRETNPAAWEAIASVLRTRVTDPKGFRRDYYGEVVVRDKDGAKVKSFRSKEEAQKFIAEQKRDDLTIGEQSADALSEEIGGELEELASDLNGNLMTDQSFWREVFAKVEAENGKEAKGIIARIVAQLQALLDMAAAAIKGDKFRADDFVSQLDADVKAIRAAYRDALAQHLKDTGQRQTSMAAATQRASKEIRRSTAKDVPPGSITVEGYHYSKQSRPALTTATFGTGLQGSARDEIMSAPDKRIRSRLYFYVNKGTGINPEAGVGAYVHRATLTGIYDGDADLLRLKSGNARAFESKVLDAGFSGYLTRMEGTQSGQVILLGDQVVMPDQLGPGKITGAKVVPAPQQRDLDIGDRIMANRALPSGSPRLSRWAEIMATAMPEEAALLTEAGVFEGRDESIYKDELVARARKALGTERPKVTPQAAGVIFRALDTGRILLAKRGSKVTEPGTWGVPGGSVDKGESLVEAALRESREEMGFTGTVSMSPVASIKFGQVTYNTFIADVPSEFAPRLNGETSEARWFDPDKMPAGLHPGLQQIADKVVEATSPEARRSTERAKAEADEVDAKYRDTDQWLKAPDGTATQLTERQWLHVRTPSFKKWFGDWEKFAGQPGGVWNDDKGVVSKAVGPNGEPLVVYHGTTNGGFAEFWKPSGTKRGDLGIFLTENLSMAQTYVRRGRGRLLGAADIAEPDERRDDVPGIYALFANIRSPNESDFEGANWEGSRNGQFIVEDDNGEQLYTDEGRGYFEDRNDAEALAESKGGNVGPAPDHYETTDGVVREARRMDRDGALIRGVVDDGGGAGPYAGEPSDIFVAFDPNQVKSADFNAGEYSVTEDDIRRSSERKRKQDPAVGDKTDVSRLPDGSAIPQQAAVGSLESSLRLAASKSYRRGRDLKVDIQARVLAAARAARISLSDRTKSTFGFLSGMVMDDAKFALKSNENAVGWYDEKVSRALGALSTLHPEIETDPASRLAFLWALAVTSNGLKVDKNFDLAVTAYRQWKASGTMPTNVGIGNAAQAINKGLGAFNELTVKVGDKRLLKFMSTKFTAGEIERMLGFKVGGEWKGTPVRGAAILGPKIGNGFFSNLNGYFDALTMDRWLMRTWGRMTGTLLEVTDADIKKSRKKLEANIKALSPAERRTLSGLIGKPVKAVLTRAEIDAVSKASQKASMKVEKREVMQSTPAMNDFRKAANGHHMTLDGQKEAPSGPAERNWIRAVFQDALDQMRADGLNMTMSDLQALLWYPERRLYDAAKSDEDIEASYEDDEAPDYANAAFNLAVKNGIARQAVTAAMDAAEARGTVVGAPLTDAERTAMLKEFRAPPEQQFQLAFEVAPNPDNTEATKRWNGLPKKEKERITKLVKDGVLTELADALGLKVGKSVAALGGFEGEINPNIVTEYKPKQVSIQQARALAAAIGMALDQKSVAVMDARASQEVGMVRIKLAKKADAMVPRIMAAITAEVPAANGFTARGQNIDILNFTDLSSEELSNKIADVLDEIEEDLEYQISFGDVRSELIEESDYEGQATRVRPGYEQEVLQRIGRARDRARELVAAELAAIRSAGQVSERAGDARRADASSEVLRSAARDRGGLDQGRGDQASAGARDGDGRFAPLPGYAHGNIKGAAGPDPRLVEVAELYARQNGIDLRRQAAYVEVDPERAKRIADAYAAMPHAPQDPKVQAAYASLIEQTRAQYDALASAGYKFYFFDETNDPYQGNPWNAMRDLRATQTMGVYATEAGFGSSDLEVSDNPLLADTGIEWPFGGAGGKKKRVLANDLFRAVHDAFGHGLEGAGFRAQGEENAWQAHVRLFTGSAVGAITSETRGQNSFLNFGPSGETNRNAKVEDTAFADQKTGLMPEWTWAEGRVGDELSMEPDQDLVDLFEDLDATGQRKKRAEAAATTHPRAREIKDVNDNILDLLEELESTGALAINCD